MNAYELIGEMIAAQEAAVDQETGEVDMAKWEQAEAPVAEKQRSSILWLKALASDKETIEGERRRLAQLLKAKNNTINKVKSWLIESMQARQLGKLDFDGGIHRCWLSRRQSVEVADEDKLPSHFLEIIHTRKVRSHALKVALEAGQQGDGASLVQTNSINVPKKPRQGGIE